MWRLSTDAHTECEDRARILKQNSQYIIYTCEHTIMGQLRMGARATIYAALSLRVLLLMTLESDPRDLWPLRHLIHVKLNAFSLSLSLLKVISVWPLMTLLFFTSYIVKIVGCLKNIYLRGKSYIDLQQNRFWFMSRHSRNKNQNQRARRRMKVFHALNKFVWISQKSNKTLPEAQWTQATECKTWVTSSSKLITNSI